MRALRTKFNVKINAVKGKEGAKKNKRQYYRDKAAAKRKKAQQKVDHKRAEERRKSERAYNHQMNTLDNKRRGHEAFLRQKRDERAFKKRQVANTKAIGAAKSRSDAQNKKLRAAQRRVDADKVALAKH